MICFIEDISTFLKFKHVKLLQKQSIFAGTLPSTIEVKIKILVFFNNKILQIELMQHWVFGTVRGKNKRSMTKFYNSNLYGRYENYIWGERLKVLDFSKL